MEEQARFLEAERQFRWYTAESQSGRLDTNAYRAAINSIRVTDSQGRMWMLQEGSGLWHLWLGDRWVAAAPYTTAAPVAPPGAMPAGPTPVTRGVPTRGQAAQGSGQLTDRAGCMKQTFKYGLIAIVIFGLISLALVLFVPDFKPEYLLGVALAAVLSMLLSIRSLSKHWEGEIIDLHYEKVDVATGDDDSEYRDVLFANIREPSGKIRKERAASNWQVGRRLRKRQGQMEIEVEG
jgi:hypothetical protein